MTPFGWIFVAVLAWIFWTSARKAAAKSKPGKTPWTRATVNNVTLAAARRAADTETLGLS